MDVLRYTSSNIAVLTAVFLTSIKNNEHFIAVRISGNKAETIAKQNPIDSWFEIQGGLIDSSPNFEGYTFAPISIDSQRVVQIPTASKGLLSCEIIGRLTKTPEKITKTNDFEFVRFSLAVNITNSKTKFFNISVFKPKLIEEVNQLDKGKTMFVAGELAFYKAGEEQRLSYSIKLERFIVFE